MALARKDYSNLKRLSRAFPEIIDNLGIEKVVEIVSEMYLWDRKSLLKDPHLCLNLLDNLHILFSACKGWCGGADDISEVPDIEEGHQVFKSDEETLMTEKFEKTQPSNSGSLFGILY